MVGGIAIAEHGEIAAADVVVTASTSARSSRAVLDWYVATGEWEGRAGGYAIQGRGAALVAGIEGDYLNVVGLPLARLLELLPGAAAGHRRSRRGPPAACRAGRAASIPCSAARRPRRSTSGAAGSGSSGRSAGTP